MGKLCIACLESYSEGSLSTNHYKKNNEVYQICPKQVCKGKVVEIDELILPAILILNQKGYYTDSSCSGHYMEITTHPYVRFDPIVAHLGCVPVGFKLKEEQINDQKHITIYRSVVTFDHREMYYGIMDAASALFEWAIHLPSIGIESLAGLSDLIKEGFPDEEAPTKTAPKMDVNKLKADLEDDTIKLNPSTTSKKDE